MISHHLPAWGVCGQKARALSLFFPFKVMHVPGVPLESEVGVWNRGPVQGVDADKARSVRLAGPHAGTELGVHLFESVWSSDPEGLGAPVCHVMECFPKVLSFLFTLLFRVELNFTSLL